MGIFSSILEKVGFSDADTPAMESTPYNPKPQPVAAESEEDESVDAGFVEEDTEELVESSQAISPVDVLANLEELADNCAENLNWRTSIVDLLKLLDLDSSLTARKALANELDCPEDLMDDSAQMNMWLHKTVLQQLAAHGGNIPAELLD